MDIGSFEIKSMERKMPEDVSVGAVAGIAAVDTLTKIFRVQDINSGNLVLVLSGNGERVFGWVRIVSFSERYIVVFSERGDLYISEKEFGQHDLRRINVEKDDDLRQLFDRCLLYISQLVEAKRDLLNCFSRHGIIIVTN